MSTTPENKPESHPEQAAPHVPKIQGEQIWGPVTNTVVTTFLFCLIVIAVSIKAKAALKKDKSRLKEFFLNVVGLLDRELTTSFQDKEFARQYLPLIGGIFFIILFGNLFGLTIDWLISAFDKVHISEYLRPMHSDLNTTLVLGITTVLVFLGIAIRHGGTYNTAKGYFFNFTGNSMGERIINVFVGWLHLIGVPATVASLSLRLFGNIFAGIVLIGVIGYLGTLMTSSFFGIGGLLSLPFWFFEVFVAFIQAAVFAGLMIAYFGQSKDSKH